MCPPLPPQKSMSFNETIFIKLTVPQQIFVNMFCTGLYLDRRQNLENTSKYFNFYIYALNYRMASTAPILINLILTQRNYVKIFCTQFTKIYQEMWNAQVEIN